MNEELIPSAAPELTPEPEPVSTDPVIALPPEPDPTPVPEPDPAPVLEVISVDELINRLTQGDTPPAEEPGADEPSAEDPGEEEPGELVAEEPGEALADIPVADPDPVVGVVEQIAGKLIDMIVNLDRIEEHLEVIEQTMDHPALTTSFADYTVTEALLLLLLLSAFFAACARMLRGGFSWLRS